MLDLGIENAPHGVPLRRPEMQQAFLMLAGNRILGLAQVEGYGAILKHDRACGLAQKILHCTGKGVWGHHRIVHIWGHWSL